MSAERHNAHTETMRAPLRSSPISLALAAGSLVSGSRLCTVAGSASSGVDMPKLDGLMKQWEAEDKPKSEYVITMQPTLNDQWSRWTTVRWGEPLPMTSGKNISPFRVQKRRRKKKAARKARRRNSRQNASLSHGDECER
jgi:hypothetical protein